MSMVRKTGTRLIPHAPLGPRRRGDRDEARRVRQGHRRSGGSNIRWGGPGLNLVNLFDYRG